DVMAGQGKTDEAVAILCKAADSLGETNDHYLLLVDRLIDLGNQDRSAALVEVVAREDSMRLMTTYFRGRLALLKNEWAEGRRMLEEVATPLNRRDVRNYHKKVMAGLGRCYEVFQNPDKMLTYHLAALDDDPGYLPSQIGQAMASARLGRVED